MKQKRFLIGGATGFIGNHLVKRLKKEGHWVRGVDIEPEKFCKSEADELIIADLRDPNVVDAAMKNIDVAYCLQAKMGGALFIFTGDSDYEIMHDSALMHIHATNYAIKNGVKQLFLASSACVYPEKFQLDPNNPNCEESTAFHGPCDSAYGVEKGFSEHLYLSAMKNYNIDVKIARFHNIFGPFGTWQGGKEKSPAAICRKISLAKDGGEIEIWGDGTQTRSFLYIDECLDGVQKLMEHPTFHGPVNIGSTEKISINDLAKMVIDISGKQLKIKNIPGPLGVNGRNSHNVLCKKELNWEPTQPLRVGMEKLYTWVDEQVKLKQS